MKIAVLGTGMVGRSLAGKFEELGHDVVMGTRDPDASRERILAWHEAHERITLRTFAVAAAGSELIVLAVSGTSSLDVLELVGAETLDSKIVMDVTNPLDVSQGMPPSLTISNTDSLGEQLQRAFPDARIVKTLNTVTASLMVDPERLGDGEHTVFVSGNDTKACDEVEEILREWFGWRHVLRLGDITTARGAEMYLPLWLRMWTALETPMFNVHVVTALEQK
ncbi:MAG: hypothetical protein JWM90_1042 [Thermoleophilia bacterium]|nr:hypothetical protein [Thermoleophilia bacterium]